MSLDSFWNFWTPSRLTRYWMKVFAWAVLSDLALMAYPGLAAPARNGLPPGAAGTGAIENCMSGAAFFSGATFHGPEVIIATRPLANSSNTWSAVRPTALASPSRSAYSLLYSVRGPVHSFSNEEVPLKIFLSIVEPSAALCAPTNDDRIVGIWDRSSMYGLMPAS